MRLPATLIALVLLPTVVWTQCGLDVFAQPKTAKTAKPFPKKTAKKTVPKTKATPTNKKPTFAKETEATKAWDALEKRRKEIGKELQQIKVKFSVASRKNKEKLAKDFQKLIDEWQDSVEPGMKKLAFGVLESRPDNSLALGLIVDTHQYQNVAEATGKLLAAGHDSSEIVSAAARANFNLDKFSKAVSQLETAKSKSALGFGDEQLLTESKQLADLWKKEQEIRAKEDKLPADQRLPVVRMETNKGVIEIVLFENEAPNTVANFIALVEKKFYDGIHFHRVLQDFIVQAGDPATKTDYDPKRQYGVGGPGYTIECECYEKNARLHFRGSLSMAHSGRDSGGSQIFITHVATPHLNAPPAGVRNHHTVFGRVIKNGMKVVDALKKDDVIKKVTVLNKRKHAYKPKTSNDPEPTGKKESGKKESSKTDSKTTPKKSTPGQKKSVPPTKTKTPAKTGKK